MECIKEKIRRFWVWFEKNHRMLEVQLETDQTASAAFSVGEKLNAFGISIMSEVGGEAGRYWIQLSPCSDKTAQFICRFWKEMAPEMENWSFYSFRTPRKDGIPQIKNILGNHIDLDKMRFYVTVDEVRQRYLVTVVSPLFNGNNAEEDQSLCLMVCYILLGEAATEGYLHPLTTATAAPMDADYPNLDAAQFVSLVAATEEVRPWVTASDPTFFSIVYGSQTDQMEVRTGIQVGMTLHLQLLMQPFRVTEEFRQCGGVFCSLCSSVNAEDPQRNAEHLQKNTMKVEELMNRFQLGYVIGHAIGMEYNSIDLMVFDEKTFRAVFRDPWTLLNEQMVLEYFGAKGMPQKNFFVQ